MTYSCVVRLDPDRVRRAITLAGHTQTSAATAANIGQSHLSRLVNGSRPISGPLLARLAATLGVTPKDLAAAEPAEARQ